MAKYCYFFFFLHLLLFLCTSGRSSHIHHAENTQDFEKSHLDREKQQLIPSIHRALIEYFNNFKLTEFDSIDPPTTALPSAPVTSPPITTSPGIITVPGTSVLPPPVPTPTNPPVTNPVTPTGPVTNPVTTPSTTPNAGGTTPSGGKSWCIAKNGASQAALQSALDYACGIGGADCVTIQQGSSCYEPATLQNHASYAFNSYYQKNPVATSCDFGGVAAVTTTNPSTGSCVYQSSSSSSSSSSSTPATTPNNPTTTPITPTTTPNNPTTFPTPTTPGSNFPGTQISPPPGFSIGNPDPTGFGNLGASPPLVNSASVRPLSGSLVILVFVIMFGF